MTHLVGSAAQNRRRGAKGRGAAAARPLRRTSERARLPSITTCVVRAFARAGKGRRMMGFWFGDREGV